MGLAALSCDLRNNAGPLSFQLLKVVGYGAHSGHMSRVAILHVVVSRSAQDGGFMFRKADFFEAARQGSHVGRLRRSDWFDHRLSSQPPVPLWIHPVAGSKEKNLDGKHKDACTNRPQHLVAPLAVVHKFAGFDR